MAVMARKKLRRYIVFLFFKLLSFYIFILPVNIGLCVGKGMGYLVFCILKKERGITLQNLDIAFGNGKTPLEKRLIARGVFKNLGKNFIEVISLPKFNKYNIGRYVKCRGLETIDRLIQKGKGGIVLSAHFGNWELLAHYFAIKGYKVNVIARRVRMEYFERLLDGIRKRNGVNILYRDASAKDILKLLKGSEFVGIMPDQDMDNVSGVFVDFFDRPAYTPDGPALLNILAGAPIIPCFIVRKEFGHEIFIEEPLKLNSTGDRDRDVLENTQICTNVIEDYIRRFPEQWVWFHERWKTQP